MDNHRAKRKPQGGAAGVIIVQVFEEKPTATPRTSDAALLLPRPSGGLNPPLGYDRRQLLLAYSRQLRRLRTEQGSSAAPTWAKWKAALLHADRQIPTKRNIPPPSWIHRLWGRIRRRRGEAAPPSPATAAAKENWNWRMISRLWK